MLQIALRGVKNNPFRYVATIIAIVLGVAFFIATSVLTTSFRESLNDTITEAFADIDGAIRSTDTIETDFFDIRSQIPASTADQFEGVDGVASVAPYLSGYAQAVTAEGKTVGDNNADAQAFAWLPSTTLNPYEITSGVEPTLPTDVVMDDDTFKDGDFALGDQVRVLPLPADQMFTLVGTIKSSGDGNFGGQALSFSFDGAATVLGTTDVDMVFVEAAEGVSQAQLAANLNATIADGAQLEAITGDEFVDELKDLIGTLASIINTALQIFAGVALFVGAFVIYNTFSITVAQRTKEMALLRAIGASGRQVSISVLVEAIIIGLIASALGALVGIGLGWLLVTLLGSLSSDFSVTLSIPAGTMGLGIVIGLLITVFAAVVPARRGARVAPIEALRESAIEEVRASRTRALAGMACLGGGVSASLVALNGGSAWLYAIGLPAVIFAVFLLGPVVVKPVTGVLAIPLVRNGSITGELARENAGRNPKRTATTSLTLMIGVALMATATVFASTLSTSLRGDLEKEILATDVVEIGSNIAETGGGLDPTIAPSIGRLPGVDASVPIRLGNAEIGGDFVQVTGADTSALDQVFNLEVLDGTVVGLDENAIAISKDAAKDLDVGVGASIDVKFQQVTTSLSVVGVYDKSEELGDYLADNTVLEANTARSLDARIFVKTDGASGVNAQIDEILAGDPTAKIKSADDYISDKAGQINQLLIVLYGLLGMSVVVALIGIVNTMALSIHERTRELGLLRAVGMNRRQLRRTIRYESALVALMGTALGLMIGVFFGWLAKAAAGDAISTFSVPFMQLVAIALVGIVAGVLAGVLPARRAGKLNVLDAIASE